MSRFCQQCGSVIDDGARFCGNCGKVQDNAPAYREPVTQPAYQEPFTRAAEEAYPYQPAPASQLVYTPPQSAPIPQPPVYDEQKSSKPKKSKKGLIIGICAGAFVLIAAVAVVLVMFVFNPDNAIKKAISEQEKAYSDGDFEKLAGYSYEAVFGGDGAMEKQIEQNEAFKKEMPEYYEIVKSGKTNVLAITPLSDDSISVIKEALKRHGYTDTDAIEDIRAMIYESRNDKAEEDDRYRLYSCYVIKVDGKWYFYYNDLSADAPGKKSEKQ